MTTEKSYTVVFSSLADMEAFYYLTCLLLLASSVECAKRQGVVKRGTLSLSMTRQQRLKNLEDAGKNVKATVGTCPSTHPYPMNNLTVCCMHLHQTTECGGGYVSYRTTVECCPNADTMRRVLRCPVRCTITDVGFAGSRDCSTCPQPARDLPVITYLLTPMSLRLNIIPSGSSGA